MFSVSRVLLVTPIPAAQALGMPCYLDDLSPRGGEFPEGHRYGKRPWDFGKIYWSLKLAELGYTSLYLDNDVACMTDPLAANIVTSPFDIQVPSNVTSALCSVI